MFFLAVMLLTGCSKDSEVMAQTMTQKMYITIDGKTLSVELVDNAATQTLVAAYCCQVTAWFPFIHKYFSLSHRDYVGEILQFQ